MARQRQARACPSCGGVVERTAGEATRTVCPAFYRSAADLRQERVTVWLLACTACEWVAEAARLAAAGAQQTFTTSDIIRHTRLKAGE